MDKPSFRERGHVSQHCSRSARNVAVNDSECGVDAGWLRSGPQRTSSVSAVPEKKLCSVLCLMETVSFCQKQTEKAWHAWMRTDMYSTEAYRGQENSGCTWICLYFFSISLKACMSCQLETTEFRKQCSKSPRKKGNKCLVIRLKQGGFSLCTFCLSKKKQEEQTVIWWETCAKGNVFYSYWLRRLLSHPGHGNSEGLFVGNWTFCFKKRDVQLPMIQSSEFYSYSLFL